MDDLDITSEPPTDSPSHAQFDLTCTASISTVLRSSVRDFGRIKLINIECPTLILFKGFWDNSPEEGVLDTMARLSIYLSDVNTFLATQIPAIDDRQKLLERLAHATVLQSAPVNDIDIDTGSATQTPSEIQEATSMLVDQIIVVSKRERQPLEDIRDIAVNVLINSSIGLGK